MRSALRGMKKGHRPYIIFWKAVAFATGDDTLKSRFETNCSNCHAAFTVEQWREDAHSNSARNPILLTLYNGTDMAGNVGIVPGYKMDFPDAVKGPGIHQVHWDGRDERGKRVGSGVYLYRLKAGSFISTKKMVVSR